MTDGDSDCCRPRRPAHRVNAFVGANDFLKLVLVSDLNGLFLTPLQGENKNSFDEQRTRPKTMKNTAAPPFPLTPPAFAPTFSIQPLAFSLSANASLYTKSDPYRRLAPPTAVKSFHVELYIRFAGEARAPDRSTHPALVAPESDEGGSHIFRTTTKNQTESNQNYEKPLLLHSPRLPHQLDH